MYILRARRGPRASPGVRGTTAGETASVPPLALLPGAARLPPGLRPLQHVERPVEALRGAAGVEVRNQVEPEGSCEVRQEGLGPELELVELEGDVTGGGLCDGRLVRAPGLRLQNQEALKVGGWVGRQV